MRAAFRYLPVVAILFAAAAQAQNVAPDDAPKLLAPRNTPTRAEIDRRESLYQFTRGLLCQREDRLLEALKAFEEAARLDPSAAGVFKAQIPVLIALERGPEALEACRKVVERAPDDFEAWTILSRLHKALGQPAEAQKALERGLKARGLDDRPELAQQMHFDLGLLYEADDKYGPAADAFSKSAQLLDHPDVIADHVGVAKEVVLQRAAETYERIGDLYRKAKQFDRASAAYVIAQQRAPQRGERLSYNLAQVYQEQGADAKALAAVDRYLRTQPLGMDAYELKIAVLRRSQQAAAIVPWLEEVAQRDRYNVALHLVLARECARAKQVARAEQVYLGVAESSPSAELYRGLFHLYQDDAHAGPARIVAAVDAALTRGTRKGVSDSITVAQIKGMVAAVRDDGALARAAVAGGFKAVNQGQPLCFETLFLLASLADHHKQLAEAEKFFRTSLKQQPRQAETAVYIGLMRVLAKAQKFDAIVEVCDAGLNGNAKLGLPKAQATNQILFLTEKASALAGLKRYDAAVQAADRALLLAGDKNRTGVRLLRVRLLSVAGRTDEAEKDCLALLKQVTLPAQVLEVRYALSGVYALAKLSAKAEAQMQLILQADPENATANNDLGYMWADRNEKLVEAERMIRKAIDNDRRLRQAGGSPAALAVDPAPPPPIQPVAVGAAVTAPAVDAEDNPSYVDSLGWVLYRRGKVAEARQQLERATRLPSGEDPVIWDHLGDVYRDLQMLTEARRAWEQALRLYDRGQRRMDEDRYRDLQRKLKAPPASSN